MVLIRTLLISLLLLAIPAFAVQVMDTKDYVVMVWDAGGASAADNGCVTKTAWDARTDAEDFMTATGGPITASAAAASSDSGGSVLLTDAVAHLGTGVLVGTVAYCEWANGDGTTYANGYYEVTAQTNDTITIDLTYIANGSPDADVNVGGAISGLADLITSAPDLIDAGTYNCDIYVRGDETIAADQTIAAGGGTASTMLRILGVGDTNTWTRMTPTRAAIGAGKANSLLVTGPMPTITLGANNEFISSVNYVEIDGIYFTGNTLASMVGGTGADHWVVSNCVFANSANGGAATQGLRLDDFCSIFDCDIIMTGADAANVGLSCDTGNHIDSCRFAMTSTSATSKAIDILYGTVTNNVFYNSAGVGIDAPYAQKQAILGNTFEDVATCYNMDDSDLIYIQFIARNISKGHTIFVNNPNAAVNLVAAFYNHLNDGAGDYDADLAGDVGFQDLDTDPLFVNEGNLDYNLQATSDAKNSGPFLTNRGAMSDADGGGGQPVLGGSVVR